MNNKSILMLMALMVWCGGCGGDKKPVITGGDTSPDTKSVDLKDEVCTPACEGKECGDGVCPDQPNACGTCGNQDTCQAGQCVQGGPECPGDKDCSGLECGPDPVCGESCGACSGGESCQAGQCVQVTPGLKWVSIPGGTFVMGCSPNDPDCGGDEKPAHSVTISTFQMLETEVTEAQ
jgi:hypothetical protein